MNHKWPGMTIGSSVLTSMIMADVLYGIPMRGRLQGCKIMETSCFILMINTSLYYVAPILEVIVEFSLSSNYSTNLM